MVTQAYQGGEETDQPTTAERVVDISRVAKVVKGGRHLSFRALVVVGDTAGRVSAGIGKADAIPDAVRKATSTAEKTLISVPLTGSSIPHAVYAKFGAASVMLKPAPVGTGIIAGTSMRAVLESAGIRDIVAKSFKSQNPINVVRATLKALGDLTPAPARKLPEQKTESGQGQNEISAQIEEPEVQQQTEEGSEQQTTPETAPEQPSESES